LAVLTTGFERERSLNFLKELTFTSGQNRQEVIAAAQGQKGISGQSVNKSAADNLLLVHSTQQVPCPDVFTQASRALPFLLDQTVAVYGEINRPGLYPVVAGTPLNLLVDAAGGLTNESNTADIEYVSYENALKTGQSQYQSIDFTQSKLLSVSPGDIFTFKPLYVGREIGTVKVVGEFRFPGSFGILRGEKLSELVRRAGGLTRSAYPYGAVFTRVSAQKAEQDAYRREASELQGALVTAVTSGALGKDAQLSTQFLSSVIQNIQTAEAAGRVVIETDSAVLAAHPELDPILEPGDAIYMPKIPISVTVIGQVLNPGSLEYSPDGTVKQYIARAGGYGQAADTSRIFVILPNGASRKITNSFWSPSSAKIPPGSVIVVPRDAAPFNLLGYSDRIFGILANMAVSVAALATISKL
jgi:protein involved in polysaccharide export with SLBB domain